MIYIAVMLQHYYTYVGTCIETRKPNSLRKLCVELCLFVVRRFEFLLKEGSKMCKN